MQDGVKERCHAPQSGRFTIDIDCACAWFKDAVADRPVYPESDTRYASAKIGDQAEKDGLTVV